VRLVFLDASVWSFLGQLLEHEEIQQQATIHPKLINVINNVFQHLHYRENRGLHQPHYDVLATQVEQTFNFIFLRYSAFLRPLFDQMAKLVGSISSLAVRFIVSETSSTEMATSTSLSPILNSFLGVLLTSLKIFRQLSLDQSMPSKVYTAVVEDLLETFLALRHFISLRLKLSNSGTPLPSDHLHRLQQVNLNIERTLQQTLFAPAHIDELHGAFATSPVYGQDIFLLPKKKDNSSNESDAPIAKRPKQGRPGDMAPKFASASPSEVSKSYSKKLFDLLLKLVTGSSSGSASSGGKKADTTLSIPGLDMTSVCLESLPFIFNLCITNIFSSKGRFHQQDTEAARGENSSEPMQGVEAAEADSAHDTAVALSQKTMRVLWCVFIALQRICLSQLSVDKPGPYAHLAITSNTSLLSLVHEYDIYSHSTSGQVERTVYLANHVSQFVVLAERYSELDVLFGTFKVLLETDQIFVEDFMGVLLTIVWSKPTTSQIYSDPFCASLINVYGLLRQLDVLISRVLEFIHTTPIVGFFGPQFWTALKTAFESLPSGLIVPTFLIFVDDLHKNYVIKQSSRPDNIVHAEALFNHFLENLKLSPVLATQLCEGLNDTASMICAPLLTSFLDQAEKHASLLEKEDQRKAKKIAEEFEAGLPKNVQAGLALYHIFVTFETYCKNRFFPSHNTPEHVDLADEASALFSKLGSQVRLDQVYTLIKAIEQAHTHSSKKYKSSRDAPDASIWRFRSVLLHSMLQRATELFKMAEAVPPANLPSLVRRHGQVDTLKTKASTELAHILRKLHDEFLEFVRLLDTRPEILDVSLRTVVGSSWQVDDEASYLAYLWFSFCTHATYIISPHSPLDFATGLTSYLVKIHQTSQTPKSTTRAVDTTTNSAKTLRGSLQSSSLMCWLSASFYEIKSVRELIPSVVIRDLHTYFAKDLKTRSSLDSSLVPPHKPEAIAKTRKILRASPVTVSASHKLDLDAILSLLSILASLPNAIWNLDSVASALSTLFILLDLALVANLPSQVVEALVVGITTIFDRAAASSTPSIVASALKTSGSLGEESNDTLDLTFLVMGIQSADLLRAQAELLFLDGSKSSLKSLKNLSSVLKSKVTETEDSVAWPTALIQAFLQGAFQAFQRLDDEASSHFEWIRSTQRNNIGWKAPPAKSVVYSAQTQKTLKTMKKLVEAILKQKDDHDAQTQVLAIRAQFSLVDIATLHKSKYAYFKDKAGNQVSKSNLEDHILPFPSNLQISHLVTLINNHLLNLSTTSDNGMDVDGDAGNQNFFEFAQNQLLASFSSLSRCLPALGSLVSEDNFSEISKAMFSMLLQDKLGPKAMILLRGLVPHLSPSQCRSLLSFFSHELHKLTSREKTSLTLPSWEDMDLKTYLKQETGVKSLVAVLKSLSVFLPLIDPSVAYDVLSMYSSRLIASLCFIVESTIWPGLESPLDSSIHALVISLITQLIGDKFVELSGAELNCASSLLGVILSKFHTLQAAPTLLQISPESDLNLRVPLTTWENLANSIFTPELFTAYYHLLSTCLHARPLQTSKNLGTIILNTKILLHIVAAKTSPSSATHGSGSAPKPLKRLHAEYVGRLYNDLANLGTFMKPFAVHILVDYLCLVSKEAISAVTKHALSSGIFALVGLLEENEQNVILKAVDATGKAIFRQLYKDYERDYKYQGKA
jgi:hypothetical protein